MSLHNPNDRRNSDGRASGSARSSRRHRSHRQPQSTSQLYDQDQDDDSYLPPGQADVYQLPDTTSYESPSQIYDTIPEDTTGHTTTYPGGYSSSASQNYPGQYSSTHGQAPYSTRNGYGSFYGQDSTTPRYRDPNGYERDRESRRTDTSRTSYAAGDYRSPTGPSSAPTTYDDRSANLDGGRDIDYHTPSSSTGATYDASYQGLHSSADYNGIGSHLPYDDTIAHRSDTLSVSSISSSPSSTRSGPALGSRYTTALSSRRQVSTYITLQTHTKVPRQIMDFRTRELTQEQNQIRRRPCGLGWKGGLSTDRRRQQQQQQRRQHLSNNPGVSSVQQRSSPQRRGRQLVLRLGTRDLPDAKSQCRLRA